MIWLTLALLTSTLIMVNFKLYPRFGIASLQAIATNYLVAFICGWLTLNTESPASFVSHDWFPLSIASGTLLILVFFVFASSSAKVGIAITSVSSKMSVLIPVTLGFLVFGDNPDWIKLIGIALAIPSFWLIFKRNDRVNFKGIVIILPLLLFFGNGINDTLLKTAQFNYLKADTDMVRYLTSAFAVAFFIGVVLVIIVSIHQKQPLRWKNIFAGILLGLLNWYSTLFFLKGLAEVDVTVFIPVFNVGIVCLGAITGLVLFREKLGKWNILGLFLAVVAILLIALGHG